MSITFAHPIALLLFAAIPLYLVAARRSNRAMPLPRAADLGRPGALAWLLGLLPTLLRMLALGLLVLAIAGPAAAGTIIEEQREGVPIVLAIDISSSMLAQDFRPRDRLQVAKTTIASFARSRQGDALGLVAFAGEALTLVPPTTHSGVLMSAIESLQVGLLDDGTAIGDGLAAAVNRLRHIDDGSGVIVMLSDGENNRGIVDPLEAADAAATLAVQVYTVGVGSDGVAPVPVESAPAGFRYAELPVGLDEELLEEIAVRTGGAYFRAADPQALERIYAEIDRRVPSVIETTIRYESTGLAVWLIILAGGLLIGEWSIRSSRWGALP